MMGLPRYQIMPGARYRYEFTVDDRAGTCWYHAMAAGHTPEQVYFGLAGLIYIHDEEEAALSLPRGEYDRSIVIQDRDWGVDNTLHYVAGSGPAASRVALPAALGPSGMMGGGMMGDGGEGRGTSGMMMHMMGFFGREIFINGRPSAPLEVATHVYRWRVLNASNARTYKLAWQDGLPLTVIATDGGLLARPVQKDAVMLTPGQRVELWVDFSHDALGGERILVSRAFTGSMGEMGRMMKDMMGGSMMNIPTLPDGAEFPLFSARVTRRVEEHVELPKRLSTMVRLREQDAVNRAHPRRFRVTMGHMQWGFNGRSFEMDRVAPDEIVKRGTTEIWEFENNHMMAHAIHVHGLQFQVLERSGCASTSDVADGYVDTGWLDTVLIMPNETVKLILRFRDFTGTYAYQCHMLEHAAAGLMRDYRVRA